MTRFTPFCFIAALILGMAQESCGQTYNFFLNGMSEVPPNASSATGSCTVVVDDPSDMVTLNCMYSGLSAGISAAHIHAAAPPGMNAGVIIPLSVSAGTTSGAIAFGPASTSQTNINNIVAGLAYVNIHSNAFPGGEIRGQIVPEPTAGVLIAGAIAALSFVRRRN